MTISEIIALLVSSGVIGSAITWFATRKQNRATIEKLVQDFYSNTIRDMNYEIERLKVENEKQAAEIQELKAMLHQMSSKELEYIKQGNTLREERNMLQNEIKRCEAARLKLSKQVKAKTNGQ